MIDYSILKLLETTVGSVNKIVDKIEVDGVVKWNRTKFRYVSLGDSIAAGHTINSSWNVDYTKEGLIDKDTGEYIYDGQSTQYGYSGTTINGPFTNNVSTKIVRGSYTDLIQNQLFEIYGENHVKSISFARSGNTPDDIMDTLGAIKKADGIITVDETKPPVKALKEADLVTVCIGANVILYPAIAFIFNSMGDFAQNGDFSELQKAVRAGLQTLVDGVPSSVQTNFSPRPFVTRYSYKDLLTALTNINPKAKIVFTSIYNPLKYLYLEAGVNGSFKGLLNIIPQMTILGFELDEYYKKLIISALPADLLKHINTIADWTEEHVEGSATYDGLNRILRKAIEDFGNDNIVLAETKPFYESFPDRPIMSDKHYNDLINLQITAGYDLGDMDWSRLWGAYGKTREEYWWDLITKHTSLESGFNIGGIGFEFLIDFLIYVLPYYIDPHPFEYGQAMLARSFADTIKRKFAFDLRYNDLVHYNLEYNPNTSNGGAGEAEITEIIGLNSEIFVPIKKLKFTTLSAQEGYYFTDWISANYGYASGYYDVEGNLLCYYIKSTSNDTLYAQWSNLYWVSFYKSFNDQAKFVYDTFGGGVSSHTGTQEIYGVDISTDGGATYSTLDTSRYCGKFASSGSKLIDSRQYSYGTKFRVWVTYDDRYKSTTSHIYLNGGMLSSATKPIAVITLSSDASINFEWFLEGNIFLGSGTANWNCYINTNSTVNKD